MINEIRDFWVVYKSILKMEAIRNCICKDQDDMAIITLNAFWISDNRRGICVPGNYSVIVNEP